MNALKRFSELSADPTAQENESLPARDSFAAGVVLHDTFRIVKPLAEGGMGQVFLAHHERLPGLFAVKVLNRTLATDDEPITRFRNEAHIMAGLHHPNIVSVVDFNVTPTGAPYLVMEYLEGRDLGAIMRERGALPPAQVGAVVRQVASALDAAHARGIIHRDLKPDNVVIVPVIGQDDLVKVIDFGVSRSRFNPRLTEGNRIMGTPQFMAPEQAQGHRDDVNEAADQFALAALTYTMLAGVAPWDAFDPLQILYKVVHEKAPHLNDRLPWAERIDEVLQKALEKDPSDRFPSVLAFAEAFDAALIQDVPGGVQPLDLYEKPVSYAPIDSTSPVPTPVALRASAGFDAPIPESSFLTAAITVPIRRRIWPRLIGVIVLGSFVGIGLAFGIAIRRYGWTTVREETQNRAAQISALFETRVRRFGEGW